MSHYPRTGLLAVAAIVQLAPLSAQAQLLEDLEYRREGADAVLQIRLVSDLRFKRAAVARSNDFSQAFYDLLPTRQVLNLITSERRVEARGALPSVSVTDESTSPGQAGNERRLVVRLGSAVPHRVRAGNRNRVIEIVFEGRGAALDLPLVAAAPVPAAVAQPPAPAAAAAAAVPGAEGAAAAATAGDSAVPSAAELPARAEALMAGARAAMQRNEPARAMELLSRLLDWPTHPQTAAAQALIGDARVALGDTARARTEYEIYLKRHADGADAPRVRDALARLPQPVAAARPREVQPTTTTSGSVSLNYYGGQSKVRTQDFQDSPLSGLPELVSDATLSSADQRQLVGSVDLNWRHRDAEVDQRFVVRDSYTQDLLRSNRNRNRLTAMYYDHKSLADGWGVRLGRQSPQGGGVLGRFDGVLGSYSWRPRWKLSAVAGVPTDKLLSARRHFRGMTLDAEALTSNLGAAVYVIEQRIDGEVDRRAIGSDIRFAKEGVTALGQVDYDTVAHQLNTVSLQGTWQREDNTVVNVLYDRRNTPMLMLGNALFFVDPNATVMPTRLADLLATSSIDALRQRVAATTALSTQAAVAVTTPISPRWQIGGDIRYSNTGAILPVPDILPNGLPSSGDIWSIGAQAIGTNLYSSRDTHVVLFNNVRGPSFNGVLLSYNNASQVSESWMLEPSVRVYVQNDSAGTKSTRWAPGLRSTYRLGSLSLESELSVEQSRVTGPLRQESSSRVFYYLGGRYDF